MGFYSVSRNMTFPRERDSMNASATLRQTSSTKSTAANNSEPSRSIEAGQPTPARKTDRRVTKTLKSIRTAFYDLLEENDFEKITVSELARKADIDRKTFYLHYSSIDDLMRKESDILVDRVATALANFEPNESGMLNMRAVFLELDKITSERPLFYEHAFRTMPPNQMVDALLDRIKTLIVQRGGSEELVANPLFEMLSRFYISGTLSAFSTYFVKRDPAAKEEIMNAIDELGVVLRKRIREMES